MTNLVSTHLREIRPSLHRCIESAGPFSRWERNVGFTKRSAIAVLKIFDLFLGSIFKPYGNYLERLRCRLLGETDVFTTQQTLSSKQTELINVLKGKNSGTKRKALIIRTNHDNRIFDFLEGTLLHLASKEEIALFVEGVERNDELEKSFVKKIYGKDEKGLIFGMENEFAYSLAETLKAFSYLCCFCRVSIRDRFMFDYLESHTEESKFDLLVNLKINPVVQRYWKILHCRSTFACPLIDEIDNYVGQSKTIDLEYVQKSRSLKYFNNDGPWIEIFRTLIELMLGEAQKHGADVKKIEDYLAKPHDGNNQSNMLKQMIDWRNPFMADNILSVLPNLPLTANIVIFVGNQHELQLSALLEGSGTVEVIRWPKPEHPPEIRRIRNLLI
jgi:hypothetical protein